MICGTLESQLKKIYLKLQIKRDCQQNSLWIKAIINHLWWCCASSTGNEELIREEWLSMLNHIWGIHSWEDNKSFRKCEYGQLYQEWKWLKTNSPSFLALKKVVENKKILEDIRFSVNFVTQEVWKYFTQYSTNIVHFKLEGMIVRTPMAVLNYNCGSNNTKSTTKG